MKRCAAEPDATTAPALKRPRHAAGEAAATDRRAFAALYGGEYLGVSVSASAASRERVMWRCAVGHVWNTRWRDSKSSGAWCARCAQGSRAPARDYSAGGLRALAAANGGECLEPDAPGGGTAARRWRCSLAHEWKAAARGIASQATWCPQCAGNPRLGIAAVRELAAARGGECLSTEYVNSRRPLRWRCALGHEWSATAKSVKHRRAWCPRCSPCT